LVLVIGINKANAVRELQPAIPNAHRWYNESNNGSQYKTWEAYFSGSLCNRLYYFFHLHRKGKIVCELAEWPGWVQDGKLIAPVIEELEGVA
jgi:hypothetical protein